MILETLKQRLHAALVRPVPTEADLAAARRLAADLDDAGIWPDIEYTGTDGSRWEAIAHLDRVFVLARTRQFCSGELDAAIVRALDFWLSQDLKGPTRWHDQIIVPRLIGSTALLFEAGLSAGARGMVIEILARARWARWEGGVWVEWTGTHLTSLAFNVLLRGCIENIPALCREALERVHAAVRLAQAGEEGIQVDMSFHRSEGVPSPGSDGLAFGENCARLFTLAHGTPWQAPAECLTLFASFLLDGQQWTIRRQFLDGGAWTGGADADPARLASFAAAVEELADLGITPRRAEMAAFARRLRNPLEPTLSGHRHFWRSDLAVHQRPGFYTSVRLGSHVVSAGKPDEQADNLDGGLTCLVRDGHEYRDIVSVWDRRRLPGTTTLQSAKPHAPPGRKRNDSPAFVGGVTDGEYGVAAMELQRESLHARKAWFHFDDSFVCLGTSISCDDADAPVFTSINQCLLRGPVIAYGKAGETHVLAPGKPYDLSAAHRLEHDGIAYHFPEPIPVRARLSAQTGHRPRSGSRPAEPVARDVFSLWIDHGVQPRHDAYAYTVLPAGGLDTQAAFEYEAAQIRILANGPTLQAVWHRALRLVGIVFWEPGIVPLPGGGRVAVNRPCVVLCQDRRPEGMRLSIANPAGDAATIHVEYANRCLCFNLPGGPQGGQGVTRVL